jgi:hypothetical protein
MTTQPATEYFCPCAACKAKKRREDEWARQAASGVFLASPQRPEGRKRFVPDHRSILDEDFIFDATLEVRGDFPSDEIRKHYTTWIAETLNEADRSLPRESLRMGSGPDPSYTQPEPGPDVQAYLFICKKPGKTSVFSSINPSGSEQWTFSEWQSVDRIELVSSTSPMTRIWEGEKHE